ncbi:unnamed protein product [Cylicocyclus nassatus]|uniref:Uncharacterized protein n=1 Tax=Cylicocyclus nassatus TaxID=53992 RepID=A0AA36GN51_CYLNA|nr:unnamed protein product [Cylicocyclus nassatus]
MSKHAWMVHSLLISWYSVHFTTESTMLNVLLMITIIIRAISPVKPLKCRLNISSDDKQYIEEIMKDIPEHAPMKATIQEIYRKATGKNKVQKCVNRNGAFCTSMHIYSEKDEGEKLSLQGCDESYQCPENNCNEFTRPKSKYSISYCCCNSDLCNSTLQLELISVIFIVLLALC